MSNVSLVLLIVLIALLVITMGCGFAIHYGGEAFRNAIVGHMVLGILTLLIAIGLLISILIKS